MTLENILQFIVAFLGAYLIAFWFSLVVWVYRDIRSRSHDPIVWVFATILVLFFTIPGLLLYFILRPSETLAEQYERSLEEESLLQEIEQQLACPVCKRRVEDDFLICPVCRTKLKQVCQRCGRLLNLHWDICPYCISEVAPRVPTGPAGPAGPGSPVGQKGPAGQAREL